MKDYTYPKAKKCRPPALEVKIQRLLREHIADVDQVLGRTEESPRCRGYSLLDEAWTLIDALADLASGGLCSADTDELLDALYERYERPNERPEPFLQIEVYQHDVAHPPGQSGVKLNSTGIWVNVGETWRRLEGHRSKQGARQKVLRALEDIGLAEEWEQP